MQSGYDDGLNGNLATYTHSAYEYMDGYSKGVKECIRLMNNAKIIAHTLNLVSKSQEI